MNENCVPRRLMYVQLEGLRKVERPRARWRDEVGKDARMLVGNSHESRRMEETSEGSQDSLRVAVPMMMITKEHKNFF
jgi:hypothetical protein